MDYTEPNKLQEIATAEEQKDNPNSHSKPFGQFWGSESWGKWQTIIYALRQLGVAEDKAILDIGVGVGWTTIFLAESGFHAMGVEIAPASVEIATARAARYDADATFQAADMDTLKLDRTFDAVLVFDALHHSTRQAHVVERIAAHLRPGGWVLFGEPSWLHGVSPRARRTTTELGWVERGIGVRRLKRDCVAAGLGDFRRFYEGTQPHAGGPTSFVYQCARLLMARFASAPQMSIWLAAQKPGG